MWHTSHNKTDTCIRLLKPTFKGKINFHSLSLYYLSWLPFPFFPAQFSIFRRRWTKVLQKQQNLYKRCIIIIRLASLPLQHILRQENILKHSEKRFRNSFLPWRFNVRLINTISQQYIASLTLYHRPCVHMSIYGEWYRRVLFLGYGIPYLCLYSRRTNLLQSLDPDLPFSTFSLLSFVSLAMFNVQCPCVHVCVWICV